MNRTILTVAGLFSASSLLLVDSAVKGTALLMLAAAAAMILRRDSAATRHLVWMLAIVALLVVPVLSALLPQWRVLPDWAGISPESVVVAASPPSIARPTDDAVEVAQNAKSVEVERPSATARQPAAELPDSRLALVTPELIPESAVWGWTNALSFVWAIGFSVLILRLMAARWMLWSSECRGTVIWSSTRPAETTHDPIVTALEDVCLQLGIRRPVTLLLHPDKTIPVVWGILRCRLLLPAAARHWSGEQLRSVLLHELAHIKRRDTMAQLLTQIACALHWFNPLVWFAAWRLGVERERACDDLVLASGVRPSAYAGHLLDVVTGLSPARWTQSCGLAMARKSSLNGRLVAVLSQKLNRRGVTTALAAAAMLLGVGIAVPLAMLHAAEPDKPTTETTAVNAEPKDAKSRPLFENWKTSARTDGKIPGGRIGEMAASLKTFMDLNPGHEQSVKLEPVLKKCDASRDWTPAEAAALLDEIAAITPRAEWAMRANTERKIHPGKPLPGELANAPWGKPAENGLRIAWLLEPRAKTQALDSVMKSRVLFHNTGKAPVCFATEDWIQAGGHQAKDANGKDISVWAVMREGIRLRMNFRLAPGEYAEVEGHGLGVGSHETSSEKSIYKVGCWIEAKEGDAVTFTPGTVPVSFQTWRDNEGLKNSVTVWQEMIAQRVMQESPMPAMAADRELLLRRVMKDFPGTEPTAEEIAAFVADNAKEPLARLIKTLQTRCEAMHFAGELSGGATQFRVTAAAPQKDKPKEGAKLKPTTEQKLKWGETVNGLTQTTPAGQAALKAKLPKLQISH
jgi:beta-lactamase regulating signal transducer with metallopeptidase domain